MKKTVLICDDDKDILELCTFILSKNYEVQTSLHVINILDLIEEKQPDLILMDLWIPDIGGEQATALLKKNEETKDIPVILFSANDEIQKVYERVGANGYIKKPFTVSDLKSYVASNLA
ncbi:response regulator [Fulvivirga ligni]|uniref:response regulator n=1 Tax=Fulvivirga ligni TaxID=2904246 RepID=UPI001F22140D|nr:response regulator [Fulvivirga ligni]UII19733.1 response regulator [Fulvivirga ligni]